MPAQTYWPQQYYTTTATTTNYVTTNYPWTQNCSYTTTDLSWSNWNTATTITTSANTTIYTPTYSNEVWGQWIQMGQGTITTYGQTVQTPDELRAAREVYERQNRERMERRSAARARARSLLGEFLDDEQKAELEHHGRFFVTGSRGRRYCIRAEGQSGNVDLLKPDGSLQARLCCHPRGAPGRDGFYEMLPEGDAWLMQMIEIRHDEDHFLQTANVRRGSLPTLV